ncbi:MAG: hypothetical protein Q8R55_00280, partial [Candidatus Taylorbacteria bacterium]|nr:hypothetical protein [Candidatus Taylorbacteria bacterium]
MKKHILIIYASVGLGHKVVAENIGHALEEADPNIEVKLLDILQLYKGRLVGVSTAIYTFIIKKIPRLWGFFYVNKFFQKLALPLRIPLAARKAKKLYAFIEGLKPDLILSTHPTGTALVSYLKKEKLYTNPLVTTFSDFHFQPFWVYPRVDHYLVMTEQQKQEVKKFGFADHVITVTGLPIHSVFLKKYNRPQVLKQYELSPERPIILLMGGSRGWGVKREDILALLAADPKWQIVVVTGTDATLSGQLAGISKNLKIFSNWSNQELAKLFSIATILVTKPGGLTSGQAIVNALPMVLVHPLPTLEEMSGDYLTLVGVAIAARTVAQ